MTKAKPKKTGPKGPSKPMSEKEFKQLIELIKIQCTRDEICEVLGMSDTTLTRRIAERKIEGVTNFEALYKKHQGEGKASLRRDHSGKLLHKTAIRQCWFGLASRFWAKRIGRKWTTRQAMAA